MISVTRDGRVWATYSLIPGLKTGVSPKAELATIRDLHHMMRNMDPLVALVAVSYPQISSEVSFLNVSPMNLEQAFTEIDNAAKPEPELKVIFVAPASDALPDDGVLTYQTVETVYDFNAVPERGVALVPASAFEALKCVAGNPGLFGLRLINLSGVPGSEQTAAYEATIFNLERAAYQSLVAEITLAAETKANLEFAGRTVAQAERAQYTRKDGSVKDFKDFNAFAISGEVEDEIGDDEDAT